MTKLKVNGALQQEKKTRIFFIPESDSADTSNGIHTKLQHGFSSLHFTFAY